MTRRTVVGVIIITLLLAAVSTVAIASVRGTRRSADCGPRRISGSEVQVVLNNMGGPMTGGGMMGGVRGGMMRLVAAPSRVPQGKVTFMATNTGSVNHELVVLPLGSNQIVGTRPVQSDGSINEDGSLGEASRSCGRDTGDGIAPGTAGWTTIDLGPGRYELVCNLPGHYAAGMYTQLTVV